MCGRGQYPVAKGAGHVCEDCDASCQECRGAGPTNCTTCPDQTILAAGGRCLHCCPHHHHHHHHQGPGGEEGEEEGDAQRMVSYAEDAAQQRDCCNCTETRGECILSTNFAFINEEEVPRGNLAVFITSAILLVLGLVGVVILIKRSRSKREPPDITPRGYEKLGSGGRFGGGGGGSRYGGYNSSSSSYGGRTGGGGTSGSTSHYRESQLVDLGEKRAGKGKDEDDDDDEDEDIVYMGQDGTVYRKFRYGQEENDELEYDDESYTFR